MRFEWDPEKARTNLIKHGVSFETATLVWNDPLAEFQLDGHIDGEARWRATGVVGHVTLVVVAYTDRGGLARIISARKALRHERRRYEQQGA